MNTLMLGVFCGLAFGILNIPSMLQMNFNSGREKWETISAGFIERFLIGFLIPNAQLGLSPIYTGVVLGFGFSLPSAIISRAYEPIISNGVIGGLAIGLVTQMLI